MPLLPDQPLPALRRLAAPPAGSRIAQLDALCIVVGPGSAASALRGFDHAAQIASLLERERLKPGKCAAITLSTPRQTLLVVGVLAEGADAFSRLGLAGDMLRSALARKPRRARAGHQRHAAMPTPSSRHWPRPHCRSPSTCPHS